MLLINDAFDADTLGLILRQGANPASLVIEYGIDTETERVICEEVDPVPFLSGLMSKMEFELFFHYYNLLRSKLSTHDKIGIFEYYYLLAGSSKEIEGLIYNETECYIDLIKLLLENYKLINIKIYKKWLRLISVDRLAVCDHELLKKLHNTRIHTTNDFCRKVINKLAVCIKTVTTKQLLL